MGGARGPLSPLISAGAAVWHVMVACVGMEPASESAGETA